MKKQLIATALAAALCLGASPAFAVGEERSPTVNTHPGYADVKEDDWFAPYVSICEEHGLMNGTGEGLFSPEAPLTQAEAMVLAARVHHILNGGDGVLPAAPEEWGLLTVTYEDGTTASGYYDFTRSREGGGGWWYQGGGHSDPSHYLWFYPDPPIPDRGGHDAITLTIGGEDYEATFTGQARIFPANFFKTGVSLLYRQASSHSYVPAPGTWYRDGAYYWFVTTGLGQPGGLQTLPEAADRRYFAEALANGAKGHLEAINQITALPDLSMRVPGDWNYEDEGIYSLYDWGILTGIDPYGTFAPDRGLTRAEAAAMVARVVEPSLRLTFTPADYSPFTAAGFPPDTVLFEGGVTAEAYLTELNRQIALWEEQTRGDFNWHSPAEDGQTILEAVKATTLSNLGVTGAQGLPAYKEFDIQVYYSRLIDLMGGPFGAEG